MCAVTPSVVERIEVAAESRGDMRKSDPALRFPIGESIMEASDEDDSEIEVNKDQAQRRSFATPRTDTGTEDELEEGLAFIDEDDGGEEGHDDNENNRSRKVAFEEFDLKGKLEDEKLKNYGLELELQDLRGKEKSLLARSTQQKMCTWMHYKIMEYYRIQ